MDQLHCYSKTEGIKPLLQTAHVNVKWEVLMGSDWWSWNINSSWAVLWNCFTDSAFYFNALELESFISCRDAGGKKDSLTAHVKYLVWGIITGSLPHLFHVLPAVTPNFPPVISSLIHELKPSLQLTSGRPKWIWQLKLSPECWC